MSTGGQFEPSGTAGPTAIRRYVGPPGTPIAAEPSGEVVWVDVQREIPGQLPVEEWSDEVRATLPEGFDPTMLSRAHESQLSAARDMQGPAPLHIVAPDLVDNSCRVITVHYGDGWVLTDSPLVPGHEPYAQSGQLLEAAQAAWDTMYPFVARHYSANGPALFVNALCAGLAQTYAPYLSGLRQQLIYSEDVSRTPAAAGPQPSRSSARSSSGRAWSSASGEPTPRHLGARHGGASAR